MLLKPRTRVPDLSLPTVGGTPFELAGSKPETFTMLVAYRESIS